MNLGEHAAAYGNQGWAVFPCKVNKSPYTPNGHHDATTDPKQIHALWAPRPNALIGYAPGGDIMILDSDNKVDQGKFGELTIAQLSEQLGPLPDTVMALTGGGGVHRYFKVSTPVQCKNGWQDAVDIKTAGGYVILPPSPHASGNDYRWKPGHSPDEIEIAELPQAWLEAILSDAKKRRGEKFKMPDKVGDGERNDVLTRLGGQLRANGLTRDEILATLLAANETRCDPPLDEDEVEGIANSISHYAPGKSQEYQPALDWPHVDHKDCPLKHWENTAAWCKAKNLTFLYNGLTKKVESSWEDYRELSADAMITDLRSRLLEDGYNIARADLIDHVRVIAEHNAYHPVQDFLKEVMAEWDGVSRLREAFQVFELNPEVNQDSDLLFNLFRKWMITAAKLPFNDGSTSAQGVLVIVGPQGVGKTRFLYWLLPNPKWGKTGRMIDPKNKDTIMQALGYWIVELGEYGRNLTAEKADHYKAFATDDVDEFRAPYAREAETHARTTIFYATTDTDQFLKDDAGERRNWVISINGFNEVDIDMRQLWGEVAHLALVENEPHWLTRSEIDALNGQNEIYKVRSSEYETLVDALDWNAPRKLWVYLTATEVCKALYIDTKQSRVVGRALVQLKSLGVTPARSDRARKYIMPPFRDTHHLDNMKRIARDWKMEVV